MFKMIQLISISINWRINKWILDGRNPKTLTKYNNFNNNFIYHNFINNTNPNRSNNFSNTFRYNSRYINFKNNNRTKKIINKNETDLLELNKLILI